MRLIKREPLHLIPEKISSPETDGKQAEFTNNGEIGWALFVQALLKEKEYQGPVLLSVIFI